GERSFGPEMVRPVDLANSPIEGLSVGHLEPRQLEKHAISDARPQTGAVRNSQRAGKGHASRALTCIRGAERHELARQQVSQPTRSTDQKSTRARRLYVRSIQVVFSSVYFSNACSDLSRPMPDCLNPPNGTVMSSAS